MKTKKIRLKKGLGMLKGVVISYYKSKNSFPLEINKTKTVGIAIEDRCAVIYFNEKLKGSIPVAKENAFTIYFPYAKKKQEYVYLTNNFVLTAKQIADIYKSRWQIELFFKWIKQNLKIKTFLGTSQNAVMTQIWIAMIYYLLLAYIKFQTKFKKSLLELTRMIRETLMLRRNLIDLLSLEVKTLFIIQRQKIPQLSLF